MRRIVPLVVVIAVGAAAIAGLFWRAPLLSALGLGSEETGYLGYVEGETSLIAPPVAGRLVERPVERGQQVGKGDRLFVIDPVMAKAEVARSEGALAEAQSRYENLLKGKRPEELDVLRGQRREAEASLALAETELKRQGQLLDRGFTTRQNFDQAQSQVYQLRSRVASLSAQEKVGALAARPDEIDAAKAQVEQDEANLAQAKKRLDDLMPVAPEDGLIENTFFNVGEWVPAGTPVVSLLPPFRVKLRFYLPQEDVALMKIGDTANFTCDGCPPTLKASIIYISPRAEFTPPVIYSESARSKLVFLVEARPQTPEGRLAPGLPVTVASFAK